ncbi:hypothetical protein K2173_019141 [Erythroxylum novogranatense]|uniref:peptidylprolyl isomerase n=1 Tax=Erythroxylum novogranatense TaxID=1862640 RepID=A0AAV8STR8_9ROSI|nr:hypothetical protein K2173_019141 [Erythroxylum novogranatense]
MVKTLSLGLNPKWLITHKQIQEVFIPNVSCKTSSFSCQMSCSSSVRVRRSYRRGFGPVCAVLEGAQDVGVSSSQEFEDFSVRTSSTGKVGELKISVELSGTKTRAIFNDVFDKMVAAAQPIPGFRRVKGGKTPDIPRDVLLEILGPSEVYLEVIKKAINSAVAEYVEKEGLKVSKDLRVEQSFEELDDAYVPDEKFSFDAVIQLQESN